MQWALPVHRALSVPQVRKASQGLREPRVSQVSQVRLVLRELQGPQDR